MKGPGRGDADRGPLSWTGRGPFARERASWEHLAGRLSPTTPAELAQAASAFAVDATRTHRTLTLARYTLLIESARLPSLRQQLGSTGARVNA